MAILHDIALCCHLRSHQCIIIAISYAHNYSLLYQINPSVLDYRMYSIVEFLGEKTVGIVASNWITKEGDVSTC